MVHNIHDLNFIVRDLAAAIPAWEKLLGIPVGQVRDLDPALVAGIQLQFTEDTADPANLKS